MSIARGIRFSTPDSSLAMSLVFQVKETYRSPQPKRLQSSILQKTIIRSFEAVFSVLYKEYVSLCSMVSSTEKATLKISQDTKNPLPLRKCHIENHWPRLCTLSRQDHCPKPASRTIAPISARHNAQPLPGNLIENRCTRLLAV